MLREKFRNIISIRDTPHRIALSFAVGLFVGISPLLGLHTILALALAWFLRLNRVVTFTAVYVTNPWSMIPIYTFCTWIGTLVLGTDMIPSEVDWKMVKMQTIFIQFRHILPPFFAGSTIVAGASAFLGYFTVRKVIEKSRENDFIPARKQSDVRGAGREERD